VAVTRAQLCEHTFTESMALATEAAWLRAVFDAYEAAEKVSVDNFYSEEVIYSGGVVRRAILEKKIGSVIETNGGQRIPSFTTISSGRGPIKTSHYSIFRLGNLAFTLSAVGDKLHAPRYANFREELRHGRIPTAELPFSFVENPMPEAATDAPMFMMFKHGKELVDSSLPQFALFEGYDQTGLVVWRRNLFKAQRALVGELLNVREEQVPDDQGIPTLKRHLRRIDLEARDDK
jgi:hypothetical protein